MEQLSVESVGQAAEALQCQRQSPHTGACWACGTTVRLPVDAGGVAVSTFKVTSASAQNFG